MFRRICSFVLSEQLSDLFQGDAFCFRDEKKDEDDREKAAAGVEPITAVGFQGLLRGKRESVIYSSLTFTWREIWNLTLATEI